MKTVGQILRERREALGLRLGALAKEADVAKSYLSMIENEKVDNPPSRSVLEALEKALGIAHGELLRAAEWQNTPQRVRRHVEQLAEEARRGQELARWLKRHGAKPGAGKQIDELYRSGELARRVNDALRASTPPQAKEDVAVGLDAQVPVRFRVPLINKVAAGYPNDFTDLDYPARVADEYVPCPDLSDPHAFAARVVGDSMLPEYREGDVVIFSPRVTITDGSDCFVRLEPDHQTTFKRVFFDDADAAKVKQVRLQPLNPRFAPLTVDREQVAGMYKAVWRFQRLG